MEIIIQKRFQKWRNSCCSEVGTKLPCGDLSEGAEAHSLEQLLLCVLVMLYSMSQVPTSTYILCPMNNQSWKALLWGHFYSTSLRTNKDLILTNFDTLKHFISIKHLTFTNLFWGNDVLSYKKQLYNHIVSLIFFLKCTIIDSSSVFQ